MGSRFESQTQFLAPWNDWFMYRKVMRERKASLFFPLWRVQNSLLRMTGLGHEDISWPEQRRLKRNEFSMYQISLNIRFSLGWSSPSSAYLDINIVSTSWALLLLPCFIHSLIIIIENALTKQVLYRHSVSARLFASHAHFRARDQFQPTWCLKRFYFCMSCVNSSLHIFPHKDPADARKSTLRWLKRRREPKIESWSN